jgi:hypothetical protein
MSSANNNMVDIRENGKLRYMERSGMKKKN